MKTEKKIEESEYHKVTLTLHTAKSFRNSVLRVVTNVVSKHLPEDKGFLVVHRIETIVGDHAGPELFPDGVCGQPVHVHLHVRPYLLVRQKLTRYHLWKSQDQTVSRSSEVLKCLSAPKCFKLWKKITAAASSMYEL